MRKLDEADFLAAARLERERRSERKRQARAEALATLHRSRDAFVDQADDADAADRDADRLERLADRLVAWSEELHRDLARLEVSRDGASYRGAVLTRLQAPLDVGDLAQALAESLCEGALCAKAGVVLRAAVRFAAT